MAQFLLMLLLIVSASCSFDIRSPYYLHDCASASAVKAAFQSSSRGVGGGRQRQQGRKESSGLGMNNDVWGNSRIWNNHKNEVSVHSRQLMVMHARGNSRRPTSASTSWKLPPLFAANGPSSSSTSTSTTTNTPSSSDTTLQRRRHLLTKVLSQMSSTRLLQYLDTYHIRYAPTASRHELEQLVLSHVITTKERTGSSAGRGANNNFGNGNNNGIVGVVDAEVISNDGTDDDEEQSQQPQFDVDEYETTGKKLRFNDEISSSLGRGARRRQSPPIRRRRLFPPPPETPQSTTRSERYNDDTLFEGQHEQHGSRRNRVSQNRSWGRRESRRKSANGDQYGDDSHRPQRSGRRHRPQYSGDQDARDGGRRNYNLYATNEYYDRDVDGTEVIDLDSDFRLDNEEDEDPRNQMYDNGLQIFLMGFYEAGKTATRLVTDAVVDAVLDGASDATANLGKRWRYDDDIMEEEREERGWQDANILNYSPRAEGEGRRRRRRRRRRRSNIDDYYGSKVRSLETRQDEYAPIHRVERRVPPRRRAAYYDDHIEGRRGRKEEGGVSQYMLPSETPIIGGNETVTERQSRRFPSGDGEDDDAIADSKRIYGLYADQATQKQMEREEEKAERELHHKRQWKDRLRRKFDDALGLHSPASTSVTTKESYYDSWKNQMEGVDDGRKEVLRRQLNDEYLLSASDDSTNTISGASSTYRNNRRARMRAKSNIVSTPPSSSRQPGNRSFPRSRLDEVPFWREGGTIASLLFDTRQSPSRPTRRSSRTLEQLLLSPFGRGHTVTSLFLYMSRSVLTAFGILCRWAGVRGTIPQPIVVMSVVAILVSSRRGQRMMSLALTVLAMRLVGEFIHGSLYGNEFWDDEYDINTHNWTEENNSR
ncbi:hypothetical protein ACHAXH_009381 [Discostella pseudostelligera]